MSGIDITARQSSPRLLNAPAGPSDQQRDGEEFARSLRRLESPQRALEATQPAADDAVMANVPRHAEILEQWSSVADAKRRDDDEPQPAVVPVLNDERPLRQDGPWQDADAVLETSALHTPSLAGIAAVEPLPADSATMTLNDFTALLERTGGAVVSDGEQAWRFMLHDSALAVSQVALTREAACGSWSVALTVQGGGPSLVNPHLHRLRERLEALGQGVTHVIVSREETS